MAVDVGDGLVVERREVGRVLAGHDHHLEGRAAGGRREDDGVVVGEHEPLTALLLGLGQGAPHAASRLDHLARAATDLLGDPVRHLRDRIQLEVEVRAAGSGLPAVALDDLDVERLGSPVGIDRRVARRRGPASRRARRAGARPPAAARRRRSARDGRVGPTRISHAPVARSTSLMRELGGAGLRRVDAVEGLRAERHATNEVRRLVVGRLVAVTAVGALDRLRLDLEGGALEGPIGDDRRPPAGDRVPAQLEHGGIVPDGPIALSRGPRATSYGSRPDDRRAVQLHGADVARALERVAAIDDAHDGRDALPARRPATSGGRQRARLNERTPMRSR